MQEPELTGPVRVDRKEVWRKYTGRAILVIIVIVAAALWQFVFNGGRVWLENRTPEQVDATEDDRYTFSVQAFRTIFVTEPSIQVYLNIEGNELVGDQVVAIYEHCPMNFVGLGRWEYAYNVGCLSNPQYHFDAEWIGGWLGIQHTTQLPQIGEPFFVLNINRSSVPPVTDIHLFKDNLGDYSAHLEAFLVGLDGCSIVKLY